MNVTTYLQFAASLVFVLALIGVAAVLARRLGFGQGARGGSGTRRLGIVEVLPLDGRRRLVLLRRDETEHLVILSATGEQVIEAGIHRTGRDTFAMTLARAEALPTSDQHSPPLASGVVR
jgi:flagellar protein FliO/FliZ